MKRDVLLSEYRVLVHEAVMENESERNLRMDDSKLHSKLQVIYKAASYDGLEEIDIVQIVDEFIPSIKVTRAA